MTTWHVYQLRSETELLYVGYSRSLQRRLGEHRRAKAWWPEVAEVTAEEFMTEDAARQREKEIWAAERPKYNRNNPFMTREDRLALQRTYKRSPESLERKKQWAQEYNKTAARRAALRQYRQLPEYKARKREYDRIWRQRRWQQAGPGLF